MINQEVARIFSDVADLIEISGGDKFRVNSYRRAGRSIKDLNESVGDLANRGELQSIPGIGKGTAERIMEYLTTGRMTVHQELLDKLPRGLPKLLDIPGLGPKKIQALHEELGIGSLEELEAAIAEGKLESLSGFGAKSVEKIREGIAFLKSTAGRTPLGAALPVAEALRDEVARMKGVQRVEIAGSARRGCETVGDLDLLCIADDGKRIVEAFTKLGDVSKILAAGETKGSVLVPGPAGGEIQIDLRVVPAKSFGAAWQYFTGSKEHNVRLRERAVKKGWKLNEYGLFDGDNPLAGEHEADIYDRLSLPHFPPELREDRGEMDLAELPDLITLDDIRGDLHCHTTASDGRSTIEEMAKAAKDRGYDYLAITDHSASSVIANGLSAERLLEHAEAIRKVNDKMKGFMLLAGIECDILADGSLDYDDEILARLDWVVASIHSAQQQSTEKLTKRCIAAMENPYICALGHPSGRLLGRRDAMDLDWNQVIKTAAKTGTALEINASWQRLDLKDTHVRQALDAGCRLVINTDAHSTDQLDQMHFGIRTARRGWATPASILNTLPATKLKKVSG